MDGRDHGYQIDGITKSSDNVPTGNYDHPNQFLSTPGELIKVYKATFEGPHPTEAIKGDISAMLKFTTLLYAHNKKEDLLSVFEAEREKIKKINSERLSVSLKMLLSDIERYKFRPEFNENSAGFTLNAKTLLYRFPSLVLLDTESSNVHLNVTPGRPWKAGKNYIQSMKSLSTTLFSFSLPMPHTHV